MVRNYVETCRSCHAAIPNTCLQPLKPNLLPDRPWQYVHADFKGPIGAQYYLHVVIDQYSKYPEVDIVKSTSFEKLKPCLDRLMASHGIAEKLSTDNGSPYFSTEMKEYTKQLGVKHEPVTPDPQSNIFAENVVKILCKFIHSTIAERKNPKTELQNFLPTYHSTPHTMTGKSPAEMLYGQTLKTKLLQIFTKKESHDQTKVCGYHNAKKLQQKANFDRHQQGKDKHIKIGDKILIRQPKATTKPSFDPSSYQVTQINGNRITAQRHNQKRVHDKNHIKLLKDRPNYLKPSWNKNTSTTPTNYADFDIEGKIINKCNVTHPSTLSTPSLPYALTPAISEIPTVVQSSKNTSDISNPQIPYHKLSTSLFNITSEDQDNMQSLLSNLFNNTTQSINNNIITPPQNDNNRMFQSHNVQLSWNKELNSGPVVVREGEKEDEIQNKII